MPYGMEFIHKSELAGGWPCGELGSEMIRFSVFHLITFQGNIAFNGMS
jgi:hypothetical protein